MRINNISVLWLAFREFYHFAPGQQTVVLVLIFIQGLSAGIGLLFIFPLLQIVGLDMVGTNQTGITQTADRLFNTFGVDAQLHHILFIYIVIISVIASLRYLLTVKSTILQQRYISFLRNRLYRQLLHSNWQFIVQNKMSDFIHCLSGQVQAIGHASQLMLFFLSQLVLSVIMLGLAFLLSWKMTLLAVAFAFLLLALLFPLNKIIFGSGRNQLINFKTIFQMLTEQLSSLKMIKSYASEGYHADKLSQVSEALETQQVRLTKMNALTQWVHMVGAVMAFSGFFYISLTIFTVPLPNILLLLIIFSRLLPQLTQMQKTYQQLLHKVPAFDDVHQMLKSCEKEQETIHAHQDSPQLKHAIHIKNLNFCYPGNESEIFQNLCLEIKKNQTLALVGSSGAGKSTLADIIAGLLEPSSGDIYCDEQRLDKNSRLAWRQTVAYVTQEVYLFHDSVRANLQWVLPSATEEELWQCLKISAADEFVAQLPEGLDTLIGDRGVRLSGGERQRLALARALLTRPQLLILDEATSALDNENEQQIQAALRKLQGTLTIVIIAHRETTIAEADQRINLGEKNHIEIA